MAYKFVAPSYGGSWNTLLRLTLALLAAVFLTAAITNCTKVAVGRLRPNFAVKWVMLMAGWGRGGWGGRGGWEVGGSYAPAVNLGVADSREGF